MGFILFAVIAVFLSSWIHEITREEDKEVINLIDQLEAIKKKIGNPTKPSKKSTRKKVRVSNSETQRLEHEIAELKKEKREVDGDLAEAKRDLQEAQRG